MKKALSLFLALMMCLSLCACGTGTQDPNSGNTSTDGTSQSEPEALILRDEEEGYTFINQNRFGELLTTVELTIENWMEYIEVCSYTKEIVKKDDFGEIVSTETVTKYEFGAKGAKYYYFRELVIELKDKATGELRTYKGSDCENLKEGFSLENYECTRIKGTLYLIDVPEEAITRTADGDIYFSVGYAERSYGPRWACSLYGRRVGGMIDHLIRFH